MKIFSSFCPPEMFMNLINKTLHIPAAQYILEDLFMGFLGRRFFEKCEICDFGFHSDIVNQCRGKSLEEWLPNKSPFLFTFLVIVLTFGLFGNLTDFFHRGVNYFFVTLKKCFEALKAKKKVKSHEPMSRKV